MFTKRNLEQIQNQGLTVDQIEKQLLNFREGFPSMRLFAPATPGDGIIILGEDDEKRYIEIFENSLSSGLDTLKFVPASGAASRMFKNLYEYLEGNLSDQEEFMQIFFDNLSKFAFYDKLTSGIEDKKSVVKFILFEDGLGYGSKPKGQLDFHRYNGVSRTPFEEHLVEAASYCAGSKGIAKIHFTVSPEHHEGFEKLLETVKNNYQKRLGIKFNVDFSYQHNYTDTIAADLDGNPFKDENDDLIFRPGGHGALIENLGNLDADLIFIKNIDNVVPDRLKHSTKKAKKALAGLLVTLRNKVYSYLAKLEKEGADTDKELLKKVEVFAKKELCIQFDLSEKSTKEKHAFLFNKLNRPIRICGMVKNEGEPGGGPFWAINDDGSITLQIVEKAQIDLNNKDQLELLKQSTHFNPVDIICSTKNYKGIKFDLKEFVDPKTGFISRKSKDGRELQALELPGLWNGAMSNWISIFVEVPMETFNPVKTINDLLRPEHQQ